MLLIIVTLKIIWAKRYFKSSSKWTMFPNDEDFADVFKYGPDFLERTNETTINPLW